jgi:acyl-CoA reductase-like NAD-dependent aldehyde dehydrogenase
VSELRRGTVRAMSASLEMSAKAQSKSATPHPRLDEAVQSLKERATPFARLPVRAKAELLRACIATTEAEAEAWTRAAAAAKGISMDSPLAFEEWVGGPVTTVRNLRLLAEMLDEVAKFGKPELAEDRFTTTHDGVTQVRVFPNSVMDKALYAGLRVDVRMEKGMSPNDIRARAGSFYRKSDPPGTVSLVLGAGNVASIAPMDALYKMFVEGSVCLVKMNPVNEYLETHYERSLKALVDAGYVKFVRGGGEEGAYLCAHPSVDDVHVTGSDRTHDLIVWGPPGAERERRKSAKDPFLKKPISSELGCVTPVVVVPGAFSSGELQFIAENVASMVTNNASCNCNAGKMLVTSASWPQRNEFLDRVRAVLAAQKPRKAYYPGAFDRWRALIEGRAGVEKIGVADEGSLPWTLVFGLNSKDDKELLFVTEPFCPILSETTLPESDAATFLAAATIFCNERLWGTLSAVMIIHPTTQREPVVSAALERAIADLRYGSVGVNHWSGLVYGLVTPPWGAHPTSTPENIQGGLGWVHNTFMLEGIEKVVLRGPLTISPKPPWFVTHQNAHKLAPKLVAMEAHPSWLKVPSIALAAMRST